MGKPRNGENSTPAEGSASAAFLLAQIGSHAATRFAERLAPLDFTPAHAGILRIVDKRGPVTQQALAGILGIFPSRLVALVDQLESRGFVERRDHPEDRRSYALHLTEKGRVALQSIGRVAREHQKALLAALTADEQRQLAQFLQRIADDQGLTRGVHPGYARLKS
jgi:DNA-binding MarR family transcriptional regulator